MNIESILSDTEKANILANAIDTNSILASEKVKADFRNHYTNLQTGVNGIEAMLLEIFNSLEAISPKDSHDSNLRKIVIAKSLYFFEIVSQVRSRFGFNRYSNASIRTHLLRDDKLAKVVSNFRLTNSEDKKRKCKSPHVKFYLNS